MEHLEKARERYSRGYRADIFEPKVVNSLDDIKWLVREFDPAQNKESESVEVKTGVSINKDGAEVNYNLSVPSKSKSKREIVIEGLDLIKKMQEAKEIATESARSITINGKEVKPVSFKSAEESSSWVDPLIKQWMGGVRHGTKIRWELAEGTFQYDPYEHRLTRILNEEKD